MGTILDDNIKEIIANPDTLKVLSTVDKNGVPHAVFKGSIHVNADGNIEYYELLESSKNNQNMVHSIWFKKQVAITLLTDTRDSYEILGTPVKCITAGTEFEKVYKALREKRGKESDLSSIWIIEPQIVKNETFAVRKKEDEEAYPILRHLDRILKDDIT